MRKQFTETLGGAIVGGKGLGYFEEQVRQNMLLFDRAMKMFSPFAFSGQPGQAPGTPGAAEAPAATPPAAPAAEDESLTDLKKRVEEMQAQIAKLASKS